MFCVKKKLLENFFGLKFFLVVHARAHARTHARARTHMHMGVRTQASFQDEL